MPATGGTEPTGTGGAPYVPGQLPPTTDFAPTDPATCWMVCRFRYEGGPAGMTFAMTETPTACVGIAAPPPTCAESRGVWVGTRCRLGGEPGEPPTCAP